MRTLVAIGIAAAILQGCVCNQGSRNDQVLQKQADLRTELAGQSPKPAWAAEWSGTYEFHSWWSVVVDLSPAGITYVQEGCGGIVSASYGRVRAQTPGGLEITPVIGDDYLDRVLLVRWKGERYLVPERAAGTIIERVAQGQEDPMWGFPKRIPARVAAR